MSLLAFPRGPVSAAHSKEPFLQVRGAGQDQVYRNHDRDATRLLSEAASQVSAVIVRSSSRTGA